jgi:hypothetical protein
MGRRPRNGGGRNSPSQGNLVASTPKGRDGCYALRHQHTTARGHWKSGVYHEPWRPYWLTPRRGARSNLGCREEHEPGAHYGKMVWGSGDCAQRKAGMTSSENRARLFG